MNKVYYKSLLIFFIGTLLFSCSQQFTSDAGSNKTLNVVTSGGFAAAYNLLAPEFKKQTGIKLNTSYGSSSGGAVDSIPERLKRGEPFDVIILSRPSLDRQIKAGYVIPETRTDLVKSIIGMAVRSGQPKPDISTTEKFLAVLFDAESIGYSASASGTYLSTKLFPRLGIWDQLKNKSQRILSERVASVVARGDVQIGFQQVSEILSIEGVYFVGPIPEAYQKVTVFSLGILHKAENKLGAQRLLNFLSSKKVAKTITNTGLIPVILESE